MRASEPITELDERFSSEEATAASWDAAVSSLERSELYWVTTVRPDGRPHMTPLIAVWMEGAIYFCTGSDERKAKNLVANPRCLISTGCNVLNEGLDLVVEGVAARVTDEARLQRVADLYEAKYGAEWRFSVEDAAFRHRGSLALVFELAPDTAFGFGKGTPFSQTRWSF